MYFLHLIEILQKLKISVSYTYRPTCFSKNWDTERSIGHFPFQRVSGGFCRRSSRWLFMPDLLAYVAIDLQLSI